MPDTGAQGSLAGCEEMRLRVVADPGLPYSVAAMLAGDRLPALLQRHVSAGPWRVEVESRMLPLDENGTLPLVALADEHPEGDDDLTVYLTELPAGRSRARCWPTSAPAAVPRWSACPLREASGSAPTSPAPCCMWPTGCTMGPLREPAVPGVRGGTAKRLLFLRSCGASRPPGIGR